MLAITSKYYKTKNFLNFYKKTNILKHHITFTSSVFIRLFKFNLFKFIDYKSSILFKYFKNFFLNLLILSKSNGLIEKSCFYHLLIKASKRKTKKYLLQHSLKIKPLNYFNLINSKLLFLYLKVSFILFVFLRTFYFLKKRSLVLSKRSKKFVGS